MKTLIAFDLDGTLAESKQSIDAEMAALLVRLTHAAQVVVMSGGDWPQFEQQLVGQLPADTAFDRMFLMPASGTKLYRYDGSWKQIYADVFSDEERTRVLNALDAAVVEAGFAGADGKPRLSLRSRARALLMLFLFSEVGPQDAPTRIRVGSHLVAPKVLEPYGDDGAPWLEVCEQVVPASEHLPVVSATGSPGASWPPGSGCPAAERWRPTSACPAR